MLYSESLWDQWSQKIEKDFQIKGYDHLDHKFDFPSGKKKIHDILSSPHRFRNHSFLPFIKIFIKTPRYRYQENEKEYGLETKTRPISFASHIDTYIYSYFSFVLTRKYEAFVHANGFSDCVLAYRSDMDGKCNIQFSKEVFDIVRSRGECAVLALDIKGYFDNIDHKILKEKWATILAEPELPEEQYKLFRSLTKYNYINKNTILKHFKVKLSKLKRRVATLLDFIEGKDFTEKMGRLRDENLIVTNNEYKLQPDGRKRFYGIPQGSSMSALLSNIYLIDYDKKMQEKAQSENFVYRRYCDDILIICEVDKSTELQEYAISEILKLFLVIQDKKVEKIEFRKNSAGKIRGFNLKKLEKEKPAVLDKGNEQKYYKNLQYLGFEFTGQAILIRPASLSRYFRKMKSRIVKTVSMGYSRNSKGDNIFKQQLFHKYTHLGKRNFLHYAYNASRQYYFNSQGVKRAGLNSVSIRRQLSSHFDILLHTLKSKDFQRATYKKKNTKLKRKN